jgi:hypothetical protein
MPTVLLVTGLVTWKRRRWIATNRDKGIRVAQHAEVE